MSENDTQNVSLEFIKMGEHLKIILEIMACKRLKCQLKDHF